MLLVLLYWFSFAYAEIVWDIPEVQDRQFLIATQEIQGKFTFPFGGVLGRGFFPVSVHVQNISSDNKEVIITVQHPSSQNDLLRHTIQLAAGEKKELDYVLPIPITNYGTVYFNIRTNSDHSPFNVNGNSYTYRIFEPSAFSYSEYGPARIMIGSEAAQAKYPEWYAAAQMAGKGIGFDSMTNLTSSKWLPIESASYTGQHSVIWFADEVDVEPRKSTALGNWVLNGGHVIVVSPEQKILNYSDFATWLEQRFRIPMQGYQGMATADFRKSLAELSARQKSLYKKHMSIEKLSPPDFEQFRMGRGTITLVKDNLSLYHAYLLQIDTSLNKTLLYSNHVKPNTYSNGLFDARHIKHLSKNWDELELTPDWVIILMTYAFAILIGPVNLAWMMRRKRIFILYSTPVLSAFCVCAVLLLSALLQTKQVLGLSTDISILDQRDQRLLSTEHRLFFLTKNPKEPLLPKSGHHFLPIREDDYSNADYYIEGDDNGMIYRRYSKAREIQSNWLWHDTSSRLQLQFSNGVVKNALEMDIDELYYSDEKGNLWSAKKIAKGAEVKMERIASLPNGKKHWSNRVLEDNIVGLDSLPANTYLVRSEQNPFGYHDYISQKITHNDHILYGVLP
jgi:hypothetical protein